MEKKAQIHNLIILDEKWFEYSQANSIAVNYVLIFNKDKKGIEKMVEVKRINREKYYYEVLDKIKGNNEIDLNKYFCEEKNILKENN